ncbi:MAG TPA: zinc ABC transporter substrate-binding protein [Nitrososphaeraceae archaeon]|nr:zinc ABC transporter substrate-binding protein [Nitrososphaeraceae archaeon]
MKAKKVLLLVTLSRIVALSIRSIKPLKVLIRSTPSKLSLAQSNTSISNNPKCYSKNYTARTTSVGQQSTTESKISVVASFFPIYEFVKAVGGNKIDASVLLPIGAEPHIFDPTIQQIQKTNSANLLVYNGASMEEPWIHELTPQNEVDASKGINLLTNPGDPEIKGPSDPQQSRFEEQR